MIRKVYTDLILRKLREEGPSWLIKRARQYMLIHLSEKLKRPLCGPALGTLMVTYRCNFHCTMCDMPTKASAYQKNGQSEYTTEQFKEILREFAEIGTPGIGFTGGEPLLRSDIFELMAETRRLGMIAHLNTNAWLLGGKEAEQLIHIGVDSINISLDGATAETHDRIRKAPGSFGRATGAVRLLVALKKKYNSHIRIKTVAVLDETNIDEVPDMLLLGKKLGTDCIELIPRQRFTDRAIGSTNEDELLTKVDNLVQKLLKKEFAGVALENSNAHLNLFRNSFAGKPSPVKCSAGYNSLAVDCYGNIFPCVPWINWGKTSGNIGVSTLTKVWKSHSYQQQRNKTACCHDCYLNCQTEMNLLFNLRKLY